MAKAIFTITCTTCHARLAVCSESAIGAILECPRCESMVQITPPEGWKPASALGDSTEANGGPPPLNRVAANAEVLDLDAVTPSLLRVAFGHPWMITSAALATALAVWLAMTWLRVDTDATSAIAEKASGSAPSISRTVEKAAVSPSVKEKRPTISVAEKNEQAKPDGGSLRPQSRDLERRETPAQPTTEVARTDKAVPAEPDPLPPLPEKSGTKKSRPVEVRRLAPAAVDVTARLNDPLPKIELKDAPLSAAIDLLGAMSTIPITLDLDAMWQLGVTPRDPISVQVSATTVGKALNDVAGQRGLAVVVDGGQVAVTSPAEYRESLRRIHYTVSDLTGDDKAAVAELAAMVCKLVAPESWQATGGRGSIEPERGALVVMQTGDVHRQIVAFCERLRLARRQPLKSRDRKEQFTLTTRTGLARELLDRQVTATFHAPTPLGRILAFLGEASGATILVDRAALAAAETSDCVETSLVVQKQGLGQTLTELLEPLGLAYRTFGSDVIQITTPAALDERLDVEFYSIKPWLDRHVSPERLAGRLRSRVAPSSWSDVGGQAEICYDPPSQCLLVLQSQSAQAVIERLLASPPPRQ